MSRNSDNNLLLSHKLFLQRENTETHLAYSREMEFYDAVQHGDFKRIKKLMVPLENSKLGKLSSNKLRNLKYHLIIMVAMITRFCIEGGMSCETAYTLSDIYIQQIDSCKDEEAVSLMHKEIVFDYADRMRNKKAPQISRSIKRTIDYIQNNLQTNISLNELSEISGLNKTYLCELFKKETGVTILSYITNYKIDAAGDLLVFADYKPIDVCNYFGFSSYSHFIQVFKKHKGMTPTEYKKNKCELSMLN